jgi:ribonuclease HI
MHWNAEGVMNKKTELEHILHERNINICCLQETHLQCGKAFKIRGYQSFRSDRADRRKGGILTLVRNNIHACETAVHMEGAEYQMIRAKLKDTELHILNFYCPNDRPLSLDSIEVPDTGFIAVGDFNSHSQSWGYSHMDSRGEEVEDWQDDHHLVLVNSPSDTPTFYSRRWRTTSTPDLAFCTDDVHSGIEREVGDQLGGSDHRPVFLALNQNTVRSPVPTRWNYKKAKWGLFRHRTNVLTKDLQVHGRDINNVVRELNGCILQAAKESIPRGARKEYKPYWSNQLQQLQDEMTEARSEAENNPSDENHLRLQQTKAKFLKAKLQARRQSWREKTAALNFEKDGKKLWRVVGQLNDEESRAQNITLEENGELLTGRRAANRFADNYADECNVPVSPIQQREARGEQRERARATSDVKPMKQPLTLHELQVALKKLKTRKSPGPDGITNEMLKNLGNAAVLKLLDVFNLSWESGQLAQVWREALMIPIHKKGKDKKKPASYRPISLTSCVVKTLERIVNQRLLWYLETENILASEQAGFRQFLSTEDQVTYLSQEIEDAFQEQKLVLATWIDLQKAFDKVWTDGLLVKLQRYGIASNMLRWIRAYLYNRRARVTVDGHKGKKVLLRHGVPQGGVLSPTLFLVFINDIIDLMPKGIHAAMYADDLVMWCKEEHDTTATHRMQQAADRLAAWAEEWNVSINKEKSFTTLFTLSSKKQTGTIKLGDTPLRSEDEATYLGVTFDKKQTWKPHIQQAEAKARRKLAIMRKLAGTSWGANENILKRVYQGAVRPHLEYGSSAWSTTAKTHQQSLDRVQNQALRIITGSMRSTPIKAMEDITATQPLSQRRDAKVMIQAEKFKCLPAHPMKQRMQNLTKNRLKRSSFLHESKKLARAHQSSMPSTTLPLSHNDQPQPWNEDFANLRISTTVPLITSRDDQDDLVKRTLTLAMISECYPAESWIHVYTDGSATNAVANGGAGVHVRSPEGHSTTASIPTGKHCSNYSAEVQALMQAASMIHDTTSECPQVVFLSDALSVLEALAGAKHPRLMEKLQDIAKTRRVVLQWVPAHCGIPGNEAADQLAKLGAREEQPDNSVSFAEMKTLVKAVMRPQTTRDAYHLLERWQQVVIMRLRTGHCRLNAHLFRKLKLAPSPTCFCGLDDQTPEHILQNCPLLKTIRDKTWPTATPLSIKLYGSRQDLEATASFVSMSGLAL